MPPKKKDLSKKLRKHESRIRAILDSKQLSSSVSLVLVQMALSMQGEDVSIAQIKKFIKELGYK